MSEAFKYAPLKAAKIARRIVKDALAAGYLISVNDGEETTVVRSVNAKEIHEAMASTDHDYLRFYVPSTKQEGKFALVGWVMLIWQNDAEVICDCTANDATRDLLKGAEEMAERLEA